MKFKFIPMILAGSLLVSGYATAADNSEEMKKGCYTIQYIDYLKNNTDSLEGNYEALHEHTQKLIKTIGSKYHSSLVKSIIYNTNRGDGNSITLNLSVCE